MTAASATKSSHRFVLGGLLLSALLLGSTGRVKGADPATTLDQALAEAMDKNPGIIAAKAQVELAQAQLNITRLDVARQLVALWNDRQVQENAVTSARNRLEHIVTLSKTGAVSTEAVDIAKGALIDAEAKLARAQSEWEFLTGQAPPALSAPRASSPAATVLRAPLQIPHGPPVEKIRQALNTPTQIEFIDTPIVDVCEYLKDLHRIEIEIDDQAFEDVGIEIRAVKGEVSTSKGPKGKDKTSLIISVNVKGVSLGAALQLLEDKFRETKFVVRDYGLFLTTPDRAQEAGYMPAVEFARMAADAEPAAADKLSAPGGVKEAAGVKYALPPRPAAPPRLPPRPKPK